MFTSLKVEIMYSLLREIRLWKLLLTIKVMGRGVGLVVEYLPNKDEALSSNPNITKKNI
jgi:hypothetical protein